MNWDEQALKLAGISSLQLSELKPINYCIPFIREKYAKELKVKAESPVYVGGSDGCLANLGGGILSKNKVLISLGTSGAVRTTVPEPIPDTGMRFFNYLLNEDNVVFGGATSNTGNVIKWFEDNYLRGYKGDIFQAAMQAKEDAPNQLFSPFLFGERTPHWDPDLTGGFNATTDEYSVEVLSKTVLEAIAINLFSIFDMVENKIGQFEEIILNGGLTQSKYFCQLLANVFNRNLTVESGEDYSVRGAALVAAKEMGLIDDYEDWKPNSDSLVKVIPDFKEHTQYIHKVESFLKSNQDL